MPKPGLVKNVLTGGNYGDCYGKIRFYFMSLCQFSFQAVKVIINYALFDMIA